MKKLILLVVLTICLSAAFLPGNAAAEEEPWQFGLSIYGFFPTVSGESAFPHSTGSSIEVDVTVIKKEQLNAHNAVP